ncbi:MAG: hypothetical protein JW959_01480 [Pirellulales bacterium]|nr:hypothetical protein [Pirellulales bacterium]
MQKAIDFSRLKPRGVRQAERGPAKDATQLGGTALRLSHPIILVVALMLAGCGREGLSSKIVEGAVTCGGEKVESGQIRFVPVEGTRGSTNVSAIRDGHYRIEARGGVPLGRYRVEVVAEKRTGRKVMGNTRFEPGMVDETIRLGPPAYAGPKSPLVAEITPRSNGRLDFDLPAR